jgi:hypothetical protein
MTRPARFKQSDITRAIKGAQTAGFEPSGIEVGPDGRISIIFNSEGSTSRKSGNPWDGAHES